MLTALLASGFVGGLALIGWHNSDERNRKLRRENKVLRDELNRAMEALKPRRATPDPQHWGDDVLERLAYDAGIPYPPLRLEVVEGDREAHSHATKGQEPA